jgi:hypothetical protein
MGMEVEIVHHGFVRNNIISFYFGGDINRPGERADQRDAKIFLVGKPSWRTCVVVNNLP